MNYDTKECGKRIRQLRIKSGFTQEQVANTVNIDQSFYGRIESGKKGCSVDLFIQLSTLFGVSLDYLILGRYLGELPECADVAQLKSDIEDLVDRLEKFSIFDNRDRSGCDSGFSSSSRYDKAGFPPVREWFCWA